MKCYLRVLTTCWPGQQQQQQLGCSPISVCLGTARCNRSKRVCTTMAQGVQVEVRYNMPPLHFTMSSPYHVTQRQAKQDYKNHKVITMTTASKKALVKNEGQCNSRLYLGLLIQTNPSPEQKRDAICGFSLVCRILQH